MSIRCAIPLALVLLAGCMSTTQVYEASSTGQWEQIYYSCSGPQSWYTLKLTKNSKIELAVSREAQGTFLRITFRIKNGSSIQLSTPEVVIEEPIGSIHKKTLSGFTKKPLRLQNEPAASQTTTGAAEPLIGTDTFEKAPQPYNLGPDDYFTTSIEISPEVIPTFKVHLPPLSADGTRLDVPDVSFEYKQVRFLQCLQ